VHTGGHLVDWEYNAVEGLATECHLRTPRPAGEWFWQSSRLSDAEREEAQERANTAAWCCMHKARNITAGDSGGSSGDLPLSSLADTFRIARHPLPMGALNG
jgi:hypothetical protein